MVEGELGREITQGVADGRDKANWREPGQETQSQLSKKPTSHYTNVQGARRSNSWYGIADSHIGPHIHKGEKANVPTIGEVMRQRQGRGH